MFGLSRPFIVYLRPTQQETGTRIEPMTQGLGPNACPAMRQQISTAFYKAAFVSAHTRVH